MSFFVLNNTSNWNLFRSRTIRAVIHRYVHVEYPPQSNCSSLQKFDFRIVAVFGKNLAVLELWDLVTLFSQKTFKTQNKKVKHKFQDIGLKNIKRNDERIGT